MESGKSVTLAFSADHCRVLGVFRIRDKWTFSFLILYGSSNSFALPFTHPHFVPFDELIPAAEKAAAAVGNATHGFKAVQFPGNLLERDVRVDWNMLDSFEWAVRDVPFTGSHPGSPRW